MNATPTHPSSVSCLAAAGAHRRLEHRAVWLIAPEVLADPRAHRMPARAPATHAEVPICARFADGSGLILCDSYGRPHGSAMPEHEAVTPTRFHGAQPPLS